MQPLNDREREFLVQAIIQNFPKKELTDLFKAAIDDWLDKQFSKFGRWSFYGIMASALAALGYFFVTVKIGH